MKKPLTSLEITARLKSRKQFSVANNSQRVRVLGAAKTLGISISTRECNGGFAVMFLPK